MALQLDRKPTNINAACPLGKLPVFYSESYSKTNGGEGCEKTTVSLPYSNSN